MSVLSDWVGGMSRFRMYPIPAQEAALLEQCRLARYVWNLALEQWSMWRRGKGAAPGSAGMSGTTQMDPGGEAGATTTNRAATTDCAPPGPANAQGADRSGEVGNKPGC